MLTWLRCLPRAVVEECEIVKLLAAIDPKTKEKKKVGLLLGGGDCWDAA